MRASTEIDNGNDVAGMFAARREKKAAAKAELKARLEAFYKQHNPEKLDSVDGTVDKYLGNEDKLFEALEGKYSAKVLTMAEIEAAAAAAEAGGGGDSKQGAAAAAPAAEAEGADAGSTGDSKEDSKEAAPPVAAEDEGGATTTNSYLARSLSVSTDAVLDVAPEEVKSEWGAAE